MRFGSCKVVRTRLLDMYSFAMSCMEKHRAMVDCRPILLIREIQQHTPDHCIFSSEMMDGML